MTGAVDIQVSISTVAVIEVNISSVVMSAVVDPIFNINSCSCRSQHRKCCHIRCGLYPSFNINSFVEVNISSVVTSAVVGPIFNISSCSCKSHHR